MPYCHIGTRNGRGNGSGCIVLIGLRVGVSCDKLREPESWTKDSSRVFNATEGTATDSRSHSDIQVAAGTQIEHPLRQFQHGASPVSLHAHRIVSSTDSFVRLYPFLSILLLAEDLYRALQR